MASKGSSRAARSLIYLSMLDCPSSEVDEMPFILSPTQLSLGDNHLRELRGAAVGNTVLLAAAAALLLTAAAALRRGRPYHEALATLPIPVWFLFLELLWTPLGQATSALVLHGNGEGDLALGLLTGAACVAFIIWLLVQTHRAKQMYTTVEVAKLGGCADAVLSPKYEWREAKGNAVRVAWLSCVFDGFRREHCGFAVVQLICTGTIGVLAGWNPTEAVACAGRAGIITTMPLFWSAILLKDRPFLRHIENIAELLLSLLEFAFAATTFAGMSLSDQDLVDRSATLATWVGYAAVGKFLMDILLFIRQRIVDREGCKAAAALLPQREVRAAEWRHPVARHHPPA